MRKPIDLRVRRPDGEEAVLRGDVYNRVVVQVRGDEWWRLYNGAGQFVRMAQTRDVVSLVYVERKGAELEIGQTEIEPGDKLIAVVNNVHLSIGEVLEVLPTASVQELKDR